MKLCRCGFGVKWDLWKVASRSIDAWLHARHAMLVRRRKMLTLSQASVGQSVRSHCGPHWAPLLFCLFLRVLTFLSNLLKTQALQLWKANASTENALFVPPSFRKAASSSAAWSVRSGAEGKEQKNRRTGLDHCPGDFTNMLQSSPSSRHVTVASTVDPCSVCTRRGDVTFWWLVSCTAHRS